METQQGRVIQTFLNSYIFIKVGGFFLFFFHFFSSLKWKLSRTGTEFVPKNGACPSWIPNIALISLIPSILLTALLWEASWERTSPCGKKFKVSDPSLRSKKASEREGDEKKEELELLCCLTDHGESRRVVESQEITLRENYLLKYELKIPVTGNQMDI